MRCVKIASVLMVAALALTACKIKPAPTTPQTPVASADATWNPNVEGPPPNPDFECHDRADPFPTGLKIIHWNGQVVLRGTLHEWCEITPAMQLATVKIVKAAGVPPTNSAGKPIMGDSVWADVGKMTSPARPGPGSLTSGGHYYNVTAPCSTGWFVLTWWLSGTSGDDKPRPFNHIDAGWAWHVTSC